MSHPNDFPHRDIDPFINNSIDYIFVFFPDLSGMFRRRQKSAPAIY